VRRQSLVLSASIFLAVLAARLCYLHVLWVDEAYPLAAAARLLHGDVLYRDIWFDKPPLYAWVYLLWGAQTGWLLRLADALFATLCCLLAGLAARRLFGPWEGRAAQLLLAFFLIFGLPSATVPLAPDLLVVPLALGGVLAAEGGNGFLAGLLAGVALFASAKGFLLLPVVAIWRPRACWRVLAGFGAAVLAGAGCLAAQGALRDFVEQVWRWGWLYSRDTFLEHPVGEGLRRTLNWAGFHAALVAGAAVYWWRNRDRKAFLMAFWLLTGLVSVAAGWRFFPRYYFAVLPVLVLAAARGFALMPRRARVLVLVAALCVPAVRFGVRHAIQAADLLLRRPSEWRDLAMFDDCRAAAGILARSARPGDTLFVWGYRPELNVLAGLPAATRFLDSQPLTGVLADRHLTGSRPTASSLAEANRRQLAASKPTFVVDGLGPYNPALAIGQFPDLRAWFANYEPIGETPGTHIYKRSASGRVW
jgi:4-amino-4-deoxy-L-arabinose transferase-like glycosyltransferase